MVTRCSWWSLMMITLVTVAVIMSDGHTGEHPALNHFRDGAVMESSHTHKKAGKLELGWAFEGERFWGVTVILRRGESERRGETGRQLITALVLLGLSFETGSISDRAQTWSDHIQIQHLQVISTIARISYLFYVVNLQVFFLSFKYLSEVWLVSIAA